MREHDMTAYRCLCLTAGRALNDDTAAAEFMEEVAQFDQGYHEMGLQTSHEGLAAKYQREGVPAFYARVLAELALATARFDRA